MNDSLAIPWPPRTKGSLIIMHRLLSNIGNIDKYNLATDAW